MRPKKLKISGLNSFLEEQIIDFEKLTDRGIFGIFGPTGSGKSTILDAITIAMYGKISRDTREFINTGTDNATVSYEFEIGKGSERKTYIVDRGIKRDIKSGGYKTSMARLREIKEGANIILSEGPRDVQENIIKIVGLSSDDFTRSVVLPQGKFNEFLKLTGLDRRNMLERIFNLEKYGIKLVKKIRDAKNKEQKDSDMLEGELSRYEGVSAEVYEFIKVELQKLIGEEKNLREEKKKLDERFQNSKEIWDRQEELKKYIAKKEELDKLLYEIDIKKEKYKKAQSAIAVKPFIDAAVDTKLKIENSEKELAGLIHLLKIIDEKLNLIEKEYAIALEKKEKDIPTLIERESKLKQAIDIENEIFKLEVEVKKLRNDFDTNKNQINKLSLNLNKVIETRDIGAKRSKEIEHRINEIRIEPLYKEKIQSAFDIEKEFMRHSKAKSEIDTKIKVLEADIKRKREEYEVVMHLKDDNSRDIEGLLSRQKSLEENFPGDSSILLQKKSVLDSTKLKLNEALENDKRKIELESLVLESGKVSQKAQDALIVINEDLSAKKTEFESIRHEIDNIRIKNMASILAAQVKDGEPCPVCGSVHHPELSQKVDNAAQDEMALLLNDKTAHIEKLQANLISFQGQSSKLKAEEGFKKEELEKILKKLEGIDIKVLGEEVTNLSSQFQELEVKIKNWNNDKKEVDGSLIKLRNEKNKIDISQARTAEGISKDEILLCSLVSELSSINAKYEETKTLYENIKTELGLDNIGNKLQEINKNDREISALQNEDKTLKVEKEKVEKEKDEYERQINELMLKKAQIEESGKEKAGYINTQRLRMSELSDEKAPKEYIEIVKVEMLLIKQTEEKLKRMRDDQKNEKQQAEDKKLKSIENVVTFKNIFESQITKLESALKENSFETSEIAMICILGSDVMAAIDLEVKKYQEDVSYALRYIDKIKSQLKEKSIDEETWNNIQLRIGENSEILNEKAMEIGAKVQKLKDLEKNLEVVKELNKKKKGIVHKLDLLEDLDKLVQGNRFVEYVATSQLKYIAIEASKRLKEITKGRYALELDSTGNFVMRDDFNGGMRRATDTLSGGETFLTSLALALALSSQIQLKGSAPLEFFFLDEGFGTLDSELLEIVISSLERLHSDKLCVGIISHVEELKNRVPVKLIVTPAKQGGAGSIVEIEYS